MDMTTHSTTSTTSQTMDENTLRKQNAQLFEETDRILETSGVSPAFIQKIHADLEEIIGRIREYLDILARRERLLADAPLEFAATGSHESYHI